MGKSQTCFGLEFVDLHIFSLLLYCRLFHEKEYFVLELTLQDASLRTYAQIEGLRGLRKIEIPSFRTW